MARTGARTGLGMLIGFLVDTVLGLILALALHEHSYAFVGFLLIPMIFGTIVGAFVGGMSSLGSPPPGQEPSDRID